MKNKVLYPFFGLFFLIISGQYSVAATFSLHANKTEKTTLSGSEAIGIEDSEDDWEIKWTTPYEIKNYIMQSPGPIGETTPSSGKFTIISADSLNIVPPSGETGEMAVHEDPASSGDDWVGFKAPVNVAPGGSDGDQLWVLPAMDGMAGQVMSTDGASNLSWATPLYPSQIGTTVQGYDPDLDDLADGLLTGTKVNLSALSGTIYTTGSLYGRRQVTAKTASTPISGQECSMAVITNTGANAAIVLTLPDAVAGMQVTVVVTAAYDIDINPYGTEIILNLTDAAGDAISSDSTVGSYITLVAISSTEWLMLGGSGVWTDVN